MPRSDEDEVLALLDAVDDFARQMKATLLTKFLQEDYHGWDNPKNAKKIWEDLKWHVEKGPQKAIDIANLAMMTRVIAINEQQNKAASAMISAVPANKLMEGLK